jgi:hypothetical protein
LGKIVGVTRPVRECSIGVNTELGMVVAKLDCPVKVLELS